jgi:hypothetical protein
VQRFAPLLGDVARPCRTGFGHTTIGLRWILPNLRKERMPSTPFGPPSMTLDMVRFTWHIVSVLLVGFGILLL